MCLPAGPGCYATLLYKWEKNPKHDQNIAQVTNWWLPIVQGVTGFTNNRPRQGGRVGTGGCGMNNSWRCQIIDMKAYNRGGNIDRV
jgi:hypothetical protein